MGGGDLGTTLCCNIAEFIKSFVHCKRMLKSSTLIFLFSTVSYIQNVSGQISHIVRVMIFNETWCDSFFDLLLQLRNQQIWYSIQALFLWKTICHHPTLQVAKVFGGCKNNSVGEKKARIASPPKYKNVILESVK